jgi:hypothetical protein
MTFASPQDHLGKLIRAHTKLLRKLGWNAFIKTLQFPSDHPDTLQHIPHPAASYLHRLATHGVPAPSAAKPWTRTLRYTTYKRGAHSSAQYQFRDFLTAEMLDMVCKGYWSVLPFTVLQHYPHLKLSPAGVVPQRTRRPRPIMDYSFTGVNANSLPLSPLHSMQFGHTLPRLLQRIVYANPTFGPPLLMKLDLADGYYRVRLTPEAALELAVVLPGLTPHTHLVGIPLCLPMGWTHSPPYFCAFTETAADLANHTLQDTTIAPTLRYPEHSLEIVSQQHDVERNTNFSPSILHPTTGPAFSHPLSYADIYIDDFIGLAQATTADTTLRHLLHSIDKVFRCYPLPTDKQTRKTIISSSKLQQGDGAWGTSKIILGWAISTAAGTLSLPAHKADRLRDIVSSFDAVGRTSRRRWYRFLGELRHMSTAIPGAAYLFSILQSVLVDQPQASRLRLRPLVKESLHDWQMLAAQLHSNPVPMASLVPRAPHVLAATDASGLGVGGFWVPTHYGHPATPTVFRAPFSDEVRQRLISTSNPTGTLTNSDFELAALVLCTALCSSITTLPHAALWCASDNIAAVSWCTKGSTSSAGPAAHLLRWLAQISRSNLVSLSTFHVPGTSNTLADFCSRSFHLTDQEFLHHLNTHFPINPSWTLAHVPSALICKLNSSLSCEMSPWESLVNEPIPQTTLGTFGKPSALTLTSTPHSNTHQTASSHCNSSPIVTVGEKYLPVKLQCAAERWAMPFAPLARRWPTWATKIPVCSHRANYTFV